MSDRRYVFVNNKRKSREYKRLPAAIDAGAATVKRDADWITYHVGLENQNVGIKRTFQDAKDRAQQLRRDKPIGVDVRISTKANGEGPVLQTVVFKEIEADLKVVDGPGVEGVDRFETYIKDKHPKARFAGNCVCKPDSDHKDCAATDWFDTYDGMEAMVREALRDPDYYRTKYVILRDRIYFPGGGSSYYGGVYHTHVHFSCFGGVYNKAC